MKVTFLIAFSFIILNSFGQTNNHLDNEFLRLKDSGISGLESFLLELQNDTSRNRFVKSILIDSLKVTDLDTLNFKNFEFKQICIKKTFEIEEDTIWIYEIQISTYYQNDFIFQISHSANQADKTKLIDNELTENITFTIPAFGGAKVEVHKLTGELVSELHQAVIMHSPLTYRNVKDIKLNENEILITLIVTVEKEIIGYFK